MAILKFKMAAILDLIWSLSPQQVVIGKLLQSVCVCVLCMRLMSILQNVNMSRTVTHVNKIHQPVLHGHGQPAGAILDNSNTFAVEGVRLHNMISLVNVHDVFVEQILNSNDTGQNMYED